MGRPPKVSESTAVTNWEEEMQAQAKVAAAQAAHVGAGGKFFSTRAGVLSCDGQSMPRNEVGAVIVAGVLENAFYSGDYDPDSPAPPSCYAFGQGEPDDMTPLDVVRNAGKQQNATCKGCPQNEFGTARTGRGKACKNGWRLALLPAGTFNDRTGEFTAEVDPKKYAEGEVRYLKVPPTSLGAYSKYVGQLSASVGRPPHCVFTRVSLHPHPTKQWEMRFEAIPFKEKDIFPSALLPAVMERHKQEMQLIEFPYPPPSDTPKKAPPKTTGRKFTR